MYGEIVCVNCGRKVRVAVRGTELPKFICQCGTQPPVWKIPPEVVNVEPPSHEADTFLTWRQGWPGD